VDGETFVRDEGLEDGSTYYYMVSALSDVGEGPRSSSLEVLPLGVPSPVVDLSVEATTDTVDLSWSPSLSDGGSSVTGYLVYKGTDPLDMDLWRSVGPSVLKVTDESVSEGTYYYRVVPVNDVGSGDPTTIDVVVPSRVGTAVLIGSLSFLIPLLTVILAVLLPFVIKRSRKSREEREAKEALESSKKPVSPPSGVSSSRVLGPSRPVDLRLPPRPRPQVPAMGPSGGVRMRPPNVLPPPRPAPMPVTPKDTYIRPTAPRSQVKDKEMIRRQNGRSPSEQKSPVEETIPSVDPVEKLQKLKQMKERGLISESEFQERKEQILNGI
jgi:hypothetical protein